VYLRLKVEAGCISESKLKAKLYLSISHASSEFGLLVTHFVRSNTVSFTSSQISQGGMQLNALDLLRPFKVPTSCCDWHVFFVFRSPRLIPRILWLTCRIFWLKCSLFSSFPPDIFRECLRIPDHIFLQHPSELLPRSQPIRLEKADVVGKASLYKLRPVRTVAGYIDQSSSQEDLFCFVTIEKWVVVWGGGGSCIKKRKLVRNFLNLDSVLSYHYILNSVALVTSMLELVLMTLSSSEPYLVSVTTT
jgi:hypothetical protein